ACDLIVAEEDVRFGFPEVGFGLFPAEGGAIRLSQVLPQKIALELVMTAAQFSAARALEWGLVNRVVPHGAALDEALDLAREIASKSPLGVQAARRIVYATIGTSHLDPEVWKVNDAEMRT